MTIAMLAANGVNGNGDDRTFWGTKGKLDKVAVGDPIVAGR